MNKKYLQFYSNHGIENKWCNFLPTLAETISYSEKEFIITMPVPYSDYYNTRFADRNVGMFEILDPRLKGIYQRVVNSHGHSLRDAQLNYRVDVVTNKDNSFDFHFIYWDNGRETYDEYIHRGLTFKNVNLDNLHLVTEEDYLECDEYYLLKRKSDYISPYYGLSRIFNSDSDMVTESIQLEFEEEEILSIKSFIEDEEDLMVDAD
jgi:hypothetical protein